MPNKTLVSTGKTLVPTSKTLMSTGKTLMPTSQTLVSTGKTLVPTRTPPSSASKLSASDRERKDNSVRKKHTKRRDQSTSCHSSDSGSEGTKKRQRDQAFKEPLPKDNNPDLSKELVKFNTKERNLLKKIERLEDKNRKLAREREESGSNTEQEESAQDKAIKKFIEDSGLW